MKEGVNTLLSSLLVKDRNVLLICVIPCGSLWIGLTEFFHSFSKLCSTLVWPWRLLENMPSAWVVSGTIREGRPKVVFKSNSVFLVVCV